tara:strand:- start:2772 stop:3905 length:1134 start_codon:yes stop_codon:yes gene_type:complete
MTTNNHKKIFIIAGESSGDQHAADYINQHSKLNPGIVFDAFGQSEIKKTKANLIYNTEKISVVGIIEIISKYKEITYAMKLAKDYIKKNKPSLIVLVDYIEFNFKIAKFAKQYDIPVLFYIAPQVWAWREKRAKDFIKSINHLAVIFPFEEIFFKKYTNNVTYVGHPLNERTDLINSIRDYKSRDIDLGIFPGSRESEINNNIHLMLDCIQKNKHQKIAIFYANETSLKLLKSLLPEDYHKFFISGKDLNKVSNCKKALCASGTITLELSILEIPMIVMYKLSFISYYIMKSLIKIKYIGLVNLILGDQIGSKPIIKEFIQPSYSDLVDIMVELNTIDNDEEYRNNMLDNYRLLNEKLSIKSNNSLALIAEKMISSI